MSSNILHEFSNSLHMQRATRFVVRNGRQALSDYVEQERARLGWSFGEIVRRSGEYIKSPSTLTNLRSGHVQTVSEDTLRGIAIAFDEQPSKIFEIYYGPSKGSGNFKQWKHAGLWEDAEQLNEENKPKYDALMDYVQHQVRQMLKDQAVAESTKKGKRT